MKELKKFLRNLKKKNIFIYISIGQATAVGVTMATKKMIYFLEIMDHMVLY